MQNIINTILFGKYQIISLLGAGSFGTVYLSKHLILECYRAIKLIPKSQDTHNSLLSEAQLLKSLHHPGIPILYDVEEDDTYYYLIEEYIEGESLEEYLLQQSNISQNFFLNISQQLCDIFQYLHTNNTTPILYLDLKPEHVIVCGMQIKLIDYNVATLLSNSGNIFNLYGNEVFSAPEITSGTSPNLLWDIYSIGKIMQYLSNYVDEPLSPHIQQIIHKATHAEPACRYETVDMLSSAIQKQRTKLTQPHLRKTIAVVGSHSGCGATHIAISIVSALNYMGYSSIYYEKNQTNILRQAISHLTSVKEINGMIHYKFFKGYPLYGPGIHLPHENADVTVCDYGNAPITEIKDADLILFICSNSVWRWHNALEKSESFLNAGRNLKIICNMGQKKVMKELSKYFCLPIYEYQYDADAFCITSAKLHFVLQLLQIKRRDFSFFQLKNMFIPKR